jgi:broad specificity phosphatase PhoE
VREKERVREKRVREREESIRKKLREQNIAIICHNTLSTLRTYFLTQHSHFSIFILGYIRVRFV